MKLFQAIPTLDKIADAVKAGIRMAGGTPLQATTIGVCDGIAMNHEGMHFSLTSREVLPTLLSVLFKAMLLTVLY